MTDRETAGPGMLLAPWEATAGGVRPNSAGKSRNAAVDALKICKWGFKLAGTKREEFLRLSQARYRFKVTTS